MDIKQAAAIEAFANMTPEQKMRTALTGLACYDSIFCEMVADGFMPEAAVKHIINHMFDALNSSNL